MLTQHYNGFEESDLGPKTVVNLQYKSDFSKTIFNLST